MIKHDTLISVSASIFVDLNSPLLFGRLNGLSSDSTIDILYQLGTTQDSGTKDRYMSIPWLFLTQTVIKLPVTTWGYTMWVVHVQVHLLCWTASYGNTAWKNHIQNWSKSRKLISEFMMIYDYLQLDIQRLVTLPSIRIPTNVKQSPVKVI